MYYLALNYRSENWILKEYPDIEILKKDILIGGTNGNEFKIFKELTLEIKEDRNND